MARKKVERHISFDEDKNLYYVLFYSGKDSSGKDIKSTKTFTNKQDAKKALREFEANKAKGTAITPSLIKFQDYIIYWLNDIKSLKCEETTLYGYRNIINNHLIPILGNYKLQDIKPTMINKYFKMKIDNGLSKNTIKKHYTLLKDMFKNAVNEDLLLKNPLDKIEPIKSDKKEVKFYTKEDLEKLFDIIKDDRMEIVIKLAGLLGLRREEIAGLKWKYVDLDNNEITISEVRVQAGKIVETVPRTKTASSHRTLHMPEDIKIILLNIKSEQEKRKKLLKDSYNKENYIVTWEDGSPYRPNYLSDLFTKIIRDNNLPPIGLHGLRHTFASIANELGVSLYDISKALGHSEIGTTTIYTHLFDKTHKKAINKIADTFKENINKKRE